jgi:hypothetical protein
MKNIMYLAIVFLAILSSCKKYLDVIPDNIATVDYAFRNKVVAERYLTPVILTCPITERGTTLHWREMKYGLTLIGTRIFRITGVI